MALLVLLLACATAYPKKAPISKLQLLQYIQPIVIHVLTVAVVLFIVGTAATLYVKTNELQMLQSASFSSALRAYLFSTVGTFLWLKLCAVVLIYSVLLWSRKQIFTGHAQVSLFVCGVLLCAVVYMQAYVSHAQASLFYPALSVAITCVHLFSKELIIGGLVLLTILVYTIEYRKLWHYVSWLKIYFDFIFSVALVSALLSGIYITWLHLKHFDNLALTAWGTLCIVLLCATAFLGAFRSLNLFAVGTRAVTSPFFKKLFFVLLPIEAALGLVVLFYSGYIAMTTPPFTVTEYTFSEQVVSEDVAITFSVHPYEHDAFLVTFTHPRTHAPIVPSAVAITASLAEKNIGPNMLSLHKRFGGGYIFHAADLSPKGEWVISVSAQQTGSYDAQAQFTVTYPDDIAHSVQSDTVRSFDTEARLFLIVGALLLTCVCACVVHAYRQIRDTEYTTVMSDDTSLFTPMRIMLTFFGLAVVATLLFFTQEYLNKNSFKEMCITDGYVWQQALPARDFEVTAPNALYGCTVHDGHYHFIYEDEYIYFKDVLDASVPSEKNNEIPAVVEESPVVVIYPQPKDSITSPLTITGKARGYWFFEASFQVMLVNWDGLIIAEGLATAGENWMTEAYVPFTANLVFEKPVYSDRGTLIFKKDNPSGLPEHDAAVELQIKFE